MGQKTDARIFRQGLTKKNWEFKYIEKNDEESSLFLYKTLEIQKYVNRFFELYKIRIHSCKILYSDSSLKIFLSFCITTKTFYTINKNIIKYSKIFVAPSQFTLLKKKKKKSWRKEKRKSVWHCPKSRAHGKTTIALPMKNLQKLKKIKNTQLSNFKPYLKTDLRSFQEILLKSLETYTNHKIKISVTLQNLSKYKQLSHVQIENLKRIFKQLRNFVKNSFFKEAINILFVSLSKRKSAKVLAEFLSNQFRLNQLRTDQMTISRKDNYFLGFLKQTILLLFKSEISCLIGLKIVVKGRFNKAPRARSICMHFGKFSLQSFDSRIDYYQSTAYTVNGTFGIKIWLCEKSFKNYGFTSQKN